MTVTVTSALVTAPLPPHPVLLALFERIKEGVLLSRRRREVNWALRQLGRSEDAAAYDAKGQSHTLNTRRPLAVA